ncbi:predicted protein [Naegleria gruberi]|uniref:Predicted protein n=1 Tax=Naegleria gruberi TaxID=5762 RepID=D2VDG9_NAEGR|nr:uncharacterized protein NAEGRDRAFT_48610 [Naegleria gruberi]EFC45140.1 predicted protein [Naegleria gruberi]|eukprot:XP_002677884.1 predicted protein [Naegleria gruberi strain NEG-M]
MQRSQQQQTIKLAKAKQKKTISSERLPTETFTSIVRDCLKLKLDIRPLQFKKKFSNGTDFLYDKVKNLKAVCREINRGDNVMMKIIFTCQDSQPIIPNYIQGAESNIEKHKISYPDKIMSIDTLRIDIEFPYHNSITEVAKKINLHEEELINSLITIIDMDDHQVYFKMKTNYFNEDKEHLYRYIVIGKMDQSEHAFIFDVSDFSNICGTNGAIPKNLKKIYDLCMPQDLAQYFEKTGCSSTNSDTSVRRVGFGMFFRSDTRPSRERCRRHYYSGWESDGSVATLVNSYSRNGDYGIQILAQGARKFYPTEYSGNAIIFLDCKISSDLLSGMYQHSKRIQLYKQIILQFYMYKMDVPLSDTLKNDRQFILQALQYDFIFHKYGKKFVEEFLRKDEEFIMEMIRVNPRIIRYCPKRPKYCLQAVKYDPQMLLYAPKEVKRSESIVWELFKRDASCLRYASQRLTSGPFAFKVFEYNESAFRTFCKHPFTINSISKREDLLKLVSMGSYYSKISPTLREDEEVQLAALNHDAYVWQLLRDDLKNDRNLAMEWVKKNREILGYTKFIHDYEFMVELIEENTIYFWDFKGEMKEQLFRKNKKLLMTALEDYKILDYHWIPIISTSWYSLPSSISQDREVIMLFLRKLCKNENGYRYFTFTVSGGNITINCDQYFKVCLENFQTDRDFFHLNLSKIGLNRVYAYADQSMKRDPKFIAFVFNSYPNNNITFEYDKNIVRELIPLLKTNPSQLFTDIRSLISDDKELLLLCIKNISPYCFNYASEHLKTNVDFIEECMRVNNSVIATVSLKLVRMNKELAILAFKKAVEIDIILPILKEYLADDELFQLLFQPYSNITSDRLLKICEELRISDNLKNDYELARRIMNRSIKFSIIFKDAPFIKELIIEKLIQGPICYLELNDCFKFDWDLFSTVYRKADYMGRTNLVYNNQHLKKKDVLVKLLGKGVYISDNDNGFIDKKITNVDFMLENCSQMLI